MKINYAKILTIIILTVITISISQEYAFAFPWDENRKLTWDDFQGKITSFSPDNGAVIYSDISLSYSWEYSETNECHYEFNKILATALFDKKGSFVRPWVLEDSQSGWILNHEQRHFDITEIHAKKFNERAIMELLGKKFSCPTHTTDLNSLKSKINTLARKQVHEIFDNVRKNLHKMQKDYDDDVEHSEDHKKQAQWNKKIGRQLKALEENAQKHKVMKQLQDSGELKKLNEEAKRLDFDFNPNTAQLVRVDQGTKTHLISGYIPDDLLFTKGIPVEFFIQFPDSNVKEYRTPVTGQKYFKYPLEFNSKSEKGGYKIIVRYKDQEIQRALLVVGTKGTMREFAAQNTFTIKSDCQPGGDCQTVQRTNLKKYNVKSENPNLVKSKCIGGECKQPQYVPIEEGKTTTFLISGHVSKNINIIMKFLLGLIRNQKQENTRLL